MRLGARERRDTLSIIIPEDSISCSQSEDYRSGRRTGFSSKQQKVLSRFEKRYKNESESFERPSREKPEDSSEEFDEIDQFFQQKRADGKTRYFPSRLALLSREDEFGAEEKEDTQDESFDTIEDDSVRDAGLVEVISNTSFSARPKKLSPLRSFQPNKPQAMPAPAQPKLMPNNLFDIPTCLLVAKDDRESCLYGLIYTTLQDPMPKVYVGISSDFENRIQTHTRPPQNQFIGDNDHKAKIIRSAYILKRKETMMDENMFTIALASELGYENVRGGAYCSNDSARTLKTMCLSILNCCYTCGRIVPKGHSVGHSHEHAKYSPCKIPRGPLNVEHARSLLAYLSRKYSQDPVQPILEKNQNAHILFELIEKLRIKESTSSLLPPA